MTKTKWTSVYGNRENGRLAVNKEVKSWLLLLEAEGTSEVLRANRRKKKGTFNLLGSNLPF